MNAVLNFFADTLIKPALSRYLRKERPYSYKGFSLTVFPGVFHPAFFFSTKYLFGCIERLDLSGKTCLEIGSGSGLLSLLMSRKQAKVTAIDIDANAIENTRVNLERNKSQCQGSLTIVQSDLFDELPEQVFDVIVINPPYFFSEVTAAQQYAWNCGKNGEYFRKLFSQLPGYMHKSTALYMVLADNCDIERIEGIAGTSGFIMERLGQKKILWETNYIFRIQALQKR